MRLVALTLMIALGIALHVSAAPVEAPEAIVAPTTTNHNNHDDHNHNDDDPTVRT
jgi:hypothetical protein